MTQYITEARRRRVDQELLTTIESAFEAAKDRVLPGEGRVGTCVCVFVCHCVLVGTCM